MTKLLRKMTLGALALGLAVPAMSFAADTAADTFKTKCAMCHGESGAGKGKVPALSSAAVCISRSPSSVWPVRSSDCANW